MHQALRSADMDTLGGSLLRRLDVLNIANSIICAHEVRRSVCRGDRHRRRRGIGDTLHGENLGKAGTDETEGRSLDPNRLKPVPALPSLSRPYAEITAMVATQSTKLAPS
jgi:hypothetical protein